MPKQEHSKETAFPLGIGPMIHTTTIHDNGKVYDGHGYSRSESESNAQYNQDHNNPSGDDDEDE